MNIDFYLTYDHQARRRAMFRSVATGAGIGAISQISGASMNTAVILCIVAVALAETIQAVRYVKPGRKRLCDIASLSLKPYFRRFALTGAILLVLMFLRLPEREAQALDHKLQQVSTNPTDTRNVHQAQKILARAKAAEIKISPATLGQAAQKFLIASENNPAAVDAVHAFLDYRSSFLNADASSSLLQGMKNHPLSPSWETDYYYVHRASQGRPVLEPYGRAPASGAARLNPLGANANQNRPVGDALLVKGGSIQLDGMEIKNVVFENVFVYYYGWAISLNNASFVDCKIRIARQPNANVENLLTAILSHQSVTFTASAPKAPPLGSALYSAPRI